MKTKITRHGRTVARLVAASGPGALEGSYVGIARSVAEDDDLFSTGVAWDAS